MRKHRLNDIFQQIQVITVISLPLMLVPYRLPYSASVARVWRYKNLIITIIITITITDCC